MTDTKPTSYTLTTRSELRFEVRADEKVEVVLREGTAELFGTELCIGVSYPFTNWNFAVFTWHGCLLEVTGACDVIYESNETPMASYVNTHAALENLRMAAKQNNLLGPCAMIVGGDSVGKAVLSRCLLSYAVRAGNSPIYVDLDVGQNTISIPGSIAATPIEHPIGVKCTIGPQLKTPVSYFYGHNTPRKGLELYHTLAQELAKSVAQKLERNKQSESSGVIIKTGSWIDGKGYGMLKHLIDVFFIDIVLVIGHDRLYHQLKSEKDMKNITIAKLDKSGGVVNKSSPFRESQRSNCIRQYFYGLNADLSPHQKILKFSEINIFQAGIGATVSDSLLPIGQKALLDPNKPILVTPSMDLLHSILAVSYAKTPELLLQESVAGYIYVTAIDLKHSILTCLAPSSGPLPSHLFLTGSIKWND